MSDYTSIGGTVRAAVLQKGDGTTGYTNTLRIGADPRHAKKSDASTAGITKDHYGEFWISNKSDTSSRRLAQTGTLITSRTAAVPSTSNNGHGVIVLDSNYGTDNYDVNGTSGTNPLELEDFDVKDGEIAHITWMLTLTGTPGSDVTLTIQAGGTTIAEDTLVAAADAVYSIETCYVNVGGSTSVITLSFTPATGISRERVTVSRVGFEDANPI